MTRPVGKAVRTSPWGALAEAGLGGWRAVLEPVVESRLDAAAHGDMPRWHTAVDSLPVVAGDPDRLAAALGELVPWRKGPFELGGVTVDSEWRSDLKWARVEPALEPLPGRTVLDVGCGNGYYAYRMRESGARLVIGVDPTLLYVMQFRAVHHFWPDDSIHVLPLRLEELPGDARAFDTAFSMGLLYHQRSPLEHLRQLRQALRPGGQLVLETLFLPGETACARTPPGRYARMKNVWLLPTLAELGTWLERTGFREIRVVDTSRTTTEEQRTTPWMPFESLAEALDPDNPELTAEGWPAPRRVVVVAKAP
ncbi:MAG: tRNA 5-methoxyuridine(34)/uridine 5-oxyacetic acid(34) synthase CmoB [Woeseiaceae bacterium]|nr:tRNA 5-methoxyuridine(34)/uridine 5-oxyacetic acid(34) synthase CmoB [Woeseiaceae bacterium]